MTRRFHLGWFTNFTPDEWNGPFSKSVAERMQGCMEEVGGDGFSITTPSLSVNRRQIVEVCDGLVPALQRRGLVRTEYTHATLRDNLRAF
jgi:hypothetical protein